MNVRKEITNWMGVFPAEIEDDVGKMKALILFLIRVHCFDKAGTNVQY
jgi:hypothetical protein